MRWYPTTPVRIHIQSSRHGAPATGVSGSSGGVVGTVPSGRNSDSCRARSASTSILLRPQRDASTKWIETRGKCVVRRDEGGRMDHVGSRSGGVGLRCGYEWISLNTCLGIHEGTEGTVECSCLPLTRARLLSRVIDNRRNPMAPRFLRSVP